ncbi:hypothetical protein SGGMMB4_05685 [Sodalis glossinidius str. 'morsitans']|uniref:Uncharacterized protein n=1 Tax=Sodalis glossinidius (strain morsitans) TaxID=343509 RepID=A0A193QNV5_SODGM|nr:hypothetical protein SGGMMB4_05685 [Sodalis glossinidius str. 'morsitans']
MLLVPEAGNAALSAFQRPVAECLGIQMLAIQHHFHRHLQISAGNDLIARAGEGDIGRFTKGASTQHITQEDDAFPVVTAGTGGRQTLAQVCPSGKSTATHSVCRPGTCSSTCNKPLANVPCQVMITPNIVPPYLQQADGFTGDADDYRQSNKLNRRKTAFHQPIH